MAYNLEKEGRWAKKRRLRKERKQKVQPKEKVESYRKTARLRLQEMYKAGFESKRSSDKMNAETSNKIYSKNTFETYKRQFRYFADWLSEAHKEALTLADARGYVDEYLLHLIELERSAYSITTAKAALAKVFQTEATQFIDTPPRERASIKRSRGVAVRDKNISSKTEKQLSIFSSATGLRRNEMLNIKSEDLFSRRKSLSQCDERNERRKSPNCRNLWHICRRNKRYCKVDPMPAR